jgi:hypothetical protein
LTPAIKGYRIEADLQFEDQKERNTGFLSLIHAFQVLHGAFLPSKTNLMRPAEETGHTHCKQLVKPPVGGVQHSLTVLLEFHTMRKILALSAAVASAFAMNVAHSATILIDSFNFPTTGANQFIKADSTGMTATTTVGGLGGTAQVNPSSAADGSYAITRDLFVNCISGAGSSGNPCVNASAASAQGLGYLEINTRNNMTASAAVTWTLPPNATLVSPSSYFFQIISNTTGAPGNIPTTVDFIFTGTGSNVGNNFNLSNQNFGSVAGVPAAFALGVSDVNALKGGGQLQMLLSSTGTGWSISLDQFALFTPEPTSLALVGLALLGAGVVSRRRKA